MNAEQTVLNVSLLSWWAYIDAHFCIIVSSFYEHGRSWRLVCWKKFADSQILKFVYSLLFQKVFGDKWFMSSYFVSQCFCFPLVKLISYSGVIWRFGSWLFYLLAHCSNKHSFLFYCYNLISELRSIMSLCVFFFLFLCQVEKIVLTIFFLNICILACVLMSSAVIIQYKNMGVWNGLWCNIQMNISSLFFPPVFSRSTIHLVNMSFPSLLHNLISFLITWVYHTQI